MVFNKITKLKILIPLIVFLILFCITLFRKNNTETNLLKILLPQNLLEQKDIISIANKSSSIIRVVFESDNEQLLINLKNNFCQSIDNNYFKIISPRTENLFFIYKQHPSNFLSYKTRNLLLSKRYDEVKNIATQELYNPMSIQFADFDKDPYFLLNSFLKSKDIGINTISYENGKFYDSQIIKFKNEQGLSPSVVNQKVKELIDIQNNLSNKNSAIYLAGSPIHSYYSSNHAILSINIICIFSTLLILSLTYIYFRQIKIFIPILLSIGLGFGISYLITKLSFYSFHILTLVFETTLIGIGIDYSYHYLFSSKNDMTFYKNLTLSMLTTVVAFALLFFSNIELLKQISVFTITGLLTIYMIVMFVYPNLRFPVPTKKLNCKFNKRVSVSVFSILVLLTIIGLFKISFNDTLTAFYMPTKKLQLAENLYGKVSGINGIKTSVITVSGSDIENILEKEEQITDEFDKLNIKYTSLSSLCPSIKRQNENISLVKDLYKNNLQSYQEFLSRKQINNLLNSDFLPVQLTEEKNEYSKTFWLNNNSSMIIVYSDNIPNLTNDYIKIIDVNKECSKYLKYYRIKLVKILPVVIVCIFAILSFMYNFKNAIKMIVPPLFGCIGSISIISLLGQSINLFSIIALFLILGFTIDYSIFRVVGSKKSEDAIFISCITTLFSFLALSFVNFKFISSISLILFLGIFISYIVGFLLFNEDIEQI